jgi:large subunit ribosomal protein L24
MHVKKGDKVKVIAGKDKGKSGAIMRALPRENKVIIEGVALYKRHLKGSTGKVGRIIERSRPIDASNVARIETVKIQSALDAPAKRVKSAKGAK